MWKATCSALALAALIAGGPAAAFEAHQGQLLEGKARALDGQTLLLWPDSPVFGEAADGVAVRLFGIMAPQLDDWPYGAQARATLDELLAAGSNYVTCRVQRTDGFGLPVAFCAPDGAEVDLGASLLARGWAVSRRDSLDGRDIYVDAQLYLEAECAAAEHRFGLWATFGGGAACGD